MGDRSVLEAVPPTDQLGHLVYPESGDWINNDQDPELHRMTSRAAIVIS